MKKWMGFALMVLCLGTLSSGCAQNDAPEPATPAEKESAVKKEHAVLKAGGLCEMCKERIENAAKSVAGVVSAAWDQKTQILQVDFNAAKTSLGEISQAVAKSGHDTDTDKADDETYNALHGCCKYRK
jgi:Cu(I)/Ag(I) efflux system membrane fusion protein